MFPTPILKAEMEKMEVETVRRRRLNLRALHFETDRIEFALLECFWSWHCDHNHSFSDKR